MQQAHDNLHKSMPLNYRPYSQFNILGGGGGSSGGDSSADWTQYCNVHCVVAVVVVVVATMLVVIGCNYVTCTV